MAKPDPSLSHLSSSGEARMVDVSEKTSTVRKARAGGSIRMSSEAVAALRQGSLQKGDALAAARIAGIMAAKKTHDLIPLCHPLAIDSVEVDLRFTDSGVDVETTVRTRDRTGVEMEALVAATVAALTIYDMCKSVDKSITLEDIRLLSKSGGRSGSWSRDD